MTKVTGSRPEPLTYSMIYGLVGRPSLGRKLGELLQADGFEPAGDTETADILIAHSAGCWLIPRTSQARLVIFVGAPLAEDRGRAYRRANIEIYKRSSFTRLITVLASDAYYGIRYLRRNLAITRMARYAELVMVPEASYVFMANRYDPWPHSKLLDGYLASKDWSFISMPGPHDDIWHHTELYEPIINHYAKLLAKTGA